ncbi:MAG: Wadjet anti-phage system protein JetD domain-containing protein [Streptosporangiaceae bacterium]
MKTPQQLLRDVQRRLSNTWHIDAARQSHVEGSPAEQSSWPHSFPLGTVPKATLERDFERFQGEAFVWRDWAAVHGLALSDAPRVVHGTIQRMPTHVMVPDSTAAAELCGMTWVNRLERGRARAAALRRGFPYLANLARVVRDIDGYTEVDFDLLCVTAEWFRQHSAAGLTPRQVPIPGLHAKWLNTRHATVATLAGLSALDLLPRHPARLHFTYLDPGHRAAGRRCHDSATAGDPMMPAYVPSVVVISENKDTALHFPAFDAGISVEGMGHGGATAASFPWLRECQNLFYWGDMDASGLEILDGFRAAGLPVTSVLMDLATYERYEQFGTSTDARGNPLTATACRPLAHLTDAEQQLYECLTDPLWTRYRRVEQERIPLSVAAGAVQAQLAAQTTRTTGTPDLPMQVRGAVAPVRA